MVAELVRRYMRLADLGSADLTDTMHAVYLPCVSWFVTADRTQGRVFEETVRWCYPLDVKRVLHYQAFRETLLTESR